MFEYSGTNVGSICKIEALEASLTDGFPDEYQGKLLSAIVLEPGAEWENLRFTRDTAHFLEPRGYSYPSTLKFTIPKDSSSTLADLDTLERKRWILRITDTNGVVKIMGRPDEPVSVRGELRDHGANRRDRNQYTVVAKLERGQPVPIYTF